MVDCQLMSATMAYLSIRPNIPPSTRFKWKAKHHNAGYDRMIWYVWYICMYVGMYLVNTNTLHR